MSASPDAGQARLVPNVLSGWMAHSVALVVGFVMPRLINDSVGQAALGVWDLGWSLTSYISFSGLGMAAAITHHVARYSPGDTAESVPASVTTGFYCQVVLALCMGCAVLGLFAGLPVWVPTAFGAIGVEMTWVGVYLGLAIAVGLIGDVAQGVLAGCHRTSWNEYLTIGADVALALAMIATLVAGGGIVGLAMVTLAVRAVCEIARFALAFQAYPALSFRPALWHGDDARQLMRYTVKSSLAVLQELVVQQGIRVLLAVGAGPSALACYSRYQTVVRQIARLMDRSTGVISPITSGLAGEGRLAEIQEIRRRASKAAIMGALPLIAIFAVFGDQLIRLWMGPDFVVPGVAWILALMALIRVDYGVSSRVLSGMNAHGRIAAICFAASVLAFAALYLMLRPLDVLDAAWVAVWTTAAGVSLPHYFLSCARLGTPPGAHFRAVYLPAIMANGLFLLGLLYSRALIEAHTYGWAMAVGMGSGLLLAGLYWHFGLSRDVRSGFLRVLRARLGTH